MKKINPFYYYRKFKWSSRKLTLPIPKKGIVLEVGSGGNPHPYSDVLVERYISDKHRLRPIELDSRLILADACKLPFKDDAFDYSLSFHVLEHVSEPDLFLEEMKRTSKAGYLETPNFLYERLSPFDVHLLEVALIGGVLKINKKKSAIHDDYISALDVLNMDVNWKNIFENKPELFHVQCFWEGAIEYEIKNKQVCSDWFEEPQENKIENSTKTAKSHRKSIRKLFVDYLKSSRKTSFDMGSLLVCPECKLSMEKTSSYYTCNECNVKFNSKPVPDFTNPISL